ncbi:MAG TPA: hypothetical protein DDW76_26745 [Cyanobacteria bacterium UBA11369]|nr:hypothetical protein [Cyanobacteria bacterium UBA11371]HBE32113.1 hypothetical protein [Cyanobacteria bacterium UBA11368]HBE52270.1 hypothetical protein [Cyanobacteria bacterium UBA11369]
MGLSIGAMLIPVNGISGTSDRYPTFRLQLKQEGKPLMKQEQSQPSSAVNVDYTKLRDLLAAGKWQDADVETAMVMLQAAGKSEGIWLQKEDLEKISCEDFRTLDQLWTKYSNGRFGFSAQKRIWESVGGKAGAYDYEIFKQFSDRVGWYEKEKNLWKAYDELTFNLNAPEGHLPVVPIVQSLDRSRRGEGGVVFAMFGGILIVGGYPFSLSKT